MVARFNANYYSFYYLVYRNGSMGDEKPTRKSTSRFEKETWPLK